INYFLILVESFLHLFCHVNVSFGYSIRILRKVRQCSNSSIALFISSSLHNTNRAGVIINVSSGAGKTGFPELSAYCASKFGMKGLTESLAWEVGNYGLAYELWQFVQVK
ncbi:MAG: SDR family oxidoreductase, partial [Thermoproteota archaeon]|nr:SDR family oxidoreductase [Thermoproteota archaeon]